MKTAAIICEYNPFHNGHAHHIACTKSEFDRLVCIMSGFFVQRGEPAIVSPEARAEMAMKAGADLVVMLPVQASLSSAEGFAGAGAAIAAALGAEALSFGSECGDASALMHTARALADPALPEALRPFLDRGMSFPAARQAALERLDPTAAALLARPNDLLGVEYCRAILRRGIDIKPFTIKREGAGHDAAQAEGRYASATMLRGMITRAEVREGDGERHIGRSLRTKSDLPANTQTLSSLMPKYAFDILARECAAGRGPVLTSAFDTAVTAALRMMSPEALQAIPDVSEGLEQRILQAAKTASTIEGICEGAKSKRYAWTRLRRVIWRAFLGLDGTFREPGCAYAEPGYLKVLALNGKGAQLLRDAALPVLSKGADARNLPPEARKFFAEDCRAGDIWTLGCPDAAQRAAGTLMRLSARYFG